jgi:spermidine synthase
MLMGSRCSGSEQAMAQLAFPAGAAVNAARILIGGLGMGFTLRAVLDRVGAAARITVVELLADVVHWNRGPLAAFAGHALDDARVSVHVGDLLDVLAGGEQSFDAILLDIDNGPQAFTVRSNERLYRADGLALLFRALRAGGVAVLWSAFSSPAFERRLRRAGFDARSVAVRARAGKGARHTLFAATRPGEAAHARGADRVD